MAQNEMKAKRGLPQGVRLTEGLGIGPDSMGTTGADAEKPEAWDSSRSVTAYPTAPLVARVLWPVFKVAAEL